MPSSHPPMQHSDLPLRRRGTRSHRLTRTKVSLGKKLAAPASQTRRPSKTTPTNKERRMWRRKEPTQRTLRKLQLQRRRRPRLLCRRVGKQCGQRRRVVRLKNADRRMKTRHLTPKATARRTTQLPRRRRTKVLTVKGRRELRISSHTGVGAAAAPPWTASGKKVRMQRAQGMRHSPLHVRCSRFLLTCHGGTAR